MMKINKLDVCDSCVCKNDCDAGMSANCCLVGNHRYSEEICPNCGHIFCYSCCGGTNVDQGGKYAPDYMYCPKCSHDIKKPNNGHE